MLRFIGRVILCLLMVFQAVGPAVACNCGVVEESCGCAADCTTCEPVVVNDSCGECASEARVVDDCGCGSATEEPTSEVTADEAQPEASHPEPAETQKPETFAPEVPAEPTPDVETSPPTLEQTEDPLPPAPIGVPQTDTTESAPATEKVLPGPAPEETAPLEESTPGPINTEGLFDEPAPDTEPKTTPAPAAEETSTEAQAESTDTEGLFEEPTPSAAESTEEESSESTPEEQPEAEAGETDETESEADPLEGLFGPSTPTTEPETEPAPQSEPESSEPESTDEKKESEFIDPFGQVPPVLKSAGGLASREFRTWSTQTANVSYKAQVNRFSSRGVILSQPSGETVFLSFSQLSDADLMFLREQVRAQRIVLARSGAGFQPVKVAVQARAQ